MGIILESCALINESTRKTLFKLEVSGAVFVSIAAVVLHFLYEWSGKEVWASLFSAVNESVWEHLKIFSLPYVIWAFVELCCVRVPFRKFVSAKVLSLYFMFIIIPAFFYTYSGIFGRNIAFVDILSGFAFTVMTFILSYRMIVNAPCIEKYFKLSLVLFALYYVMIAFFTYSPPRLEIFKDPISGNYGVAINA